MSALDKIFEFKGEENFAPLHMEIWKQAEKELAQLRLTLASKTEAMDELKFSLEGFVLIAKAFLDVKENSDEKDIPMTNVIQWIKDAETWLEKYGDNK